MVLSIYYIMIYTTVWGDCRQQYLGQCVSSLDKKICVGPAIMHTALINVISLIISYIVLYMFFELVVSHQEFMCFCTQIIHLTMLLLGNTICFSVQKICYQHDLITIILSSQLYLCGSDNLTYLNEMSYYCSLF